MTKFIQEIQHVMQKAASFFDDRDYFYEAKIMRNLLRTWYFDFSIRELCEQTFQIGAYDADYHYSVEGWETMVVEITLLLEKLVAKRRTNTIRNELLTVVRMKMIREELLATAMSPERVYSITERYGASAAYETFA
jgi:hypothetical protein